MTQHHLNQQMSKVIITLYTNRKIFKSIESKLNAQNAELNERGRVIEELKTSLSLFIDKYNKLKNDFEKEKQMGINLALSFASPKVGALRKNINQQLSITKAVGLILRGVDSKKFLIINLEKERDELKSQLVQMKKSNEDMYQILGKVKNDIDDYKGQIMQLKNTIGELQSELTKEKNDNSDLLRQLSQLKGSNNDEVALLRKNNEEGLKEVERLKEQLELMKKTYEEKEKEIKGEYSKKIEQEHDIKSILLKEKEEIKTELNDNQIKMTELEMELSCEKKLNEELKKLIQEQSFKLDYYKKESGNFKNNLKENETLMKQLELLQDKLNQLSLQSFNQKKVLCPSLIISKSQTVINYTPSLAKLQKSKTIINNSNSNTTQIETQLKTITLLQSEKDVLTKRVKELTDSLTKSKSNQKDNGRAITNNLTVIKETLMATYQSNNLAMIDIHTKLDNTVIDFTNRIAKMKKQLKEYAKQIKDKANKNDTTAVYKEKEKSMKGVISKLEQEKEKLNLKILNYESHMKDLSGKLTNFDSNTSNSNINMQNIKRENELLMKNQKNMEKIIKELEHKVEMYIIENNGKSKIIEERNQEIKKIKAKQ